eukprot:6206673-Pleurochrysis_carterae.AAC.1
MASARLLALIALQAVATAALAPRSAGCWNHGRLACKQLWVDDTAVHRRQCVVVMTGETGLPLAPAKVWRLLRRGPADYDETIARYWQGLVAAFRGAGIDDNSAQEKAFLAAKKIPALLDPFVADRFEFANVKRALVRLVGSEAAAIEILCKNPSLLLDGSGSVEGKTAAQLKSEAQLKQLADLATSPPLLLLATASVLAAAGVSIDDASRFIEKLV